MGKKVKKKSKNTQKEKKVSSVSIETTPTDSNPRVEIMDDGVSVVKEKKKVSCVHIEKLVDLDKFSAKIVSDESVTCRDCREGAIDRRDGKGRSKHGKKKGSGKDSKRVWVCLDCGHFACGAVGFPTTPQSHALRHAKQYRHHCVIQFENPQLCFCFPCSLLIPVGKSDQDDEQKDVLLEAMKLIKGRLPEGQGASVDFEDAWVGSGSIIPTSVALDGQTGYVTRGLANLGNTCFFNSVMQNLLAMDQLRDYFMKLDHSVGPLTMALKKLFNETSLGSNSRNGISPKALFGSICAKASQFRGYQQQDSHELLRYLLDGLCTEELNAKKLLNPVDSAVILKAGPTFVGTIFGGQLSSTVSCTECRHSSIVYEPFLDLSLPVPTKKPMPKKSALISRSKRTKPPLKKEVKKGGKSRGKEKIGSARALSECLTGQKENEGSGCAPVLSECLTSQQQQDSEGSGSAPGLSESLTSQLESKGSSCLASSALPLKEETVTSFDGCWWDYCGDADISVIQGCEGKETSGNDDLLQNSSEQISQVCSQAIAQKPDLIVLEGNFLENDLPLQVQPSEVILLPYKEEDLTTEEMVSKGGEASSSVDCVQDTSDFDGFGALFNEPEEESVINTVSLSGVTKLHGKEVALPLSSSESDPDEVDDTDAPVSVESCLAYFTKPELLSDEHAWHCENCSKILQGQKVDAQDKKQKVILKNWLNGEPLRRENDPSEVDAEPSKLDNANLESDIVRNTAAETLETSTNKLDESNPNSLNGEITPLDKENNSELLSTSSYQASYTELSQIDNDLLNSGCTQEETSSCMDHSESSSQPGIGDQTSQSCNMNKSDSFGSNDRVQYMDYQLKPRMRKSDDDEGVDSKCFKVMRNATKRYLIHKPPTVLTIHLKRFSQDARGRLSKLSGHVNFRDTLDLSPYVDLRSNEPAKFEYRLIGVVEHSGSMRQGHYVAYVRGNSNRGKADTWFYASDAYVRAASLEEVLRSEAYLLFYERV